jgi:hypothetical protein
MEHRQFGRSGLRLSALSLGAMTMGESHGFMKGVVSDDAEARRVLDAAFAAGLDTIDTANVYSEGRSEELPTASCKAVLRAFSSGQSERTTKCRVRTSTQAQLPSEARSPACPQAMQASTSTADKRAFMPQSSPATAPPVKPRKGYAASSKSAR